MPTVLIVSSTDLTSELGRTILWRSDIERVFAPTVHSAYEMARTMQPKLVVIDGGRSERNLDLITRLRADPTTRTCSVAVLNRAPTLEGDEDLARISSLADEEALRRAGANVVLSGPVDSFMWDYRLEELLNVPRRRETRVEARFDLWPTLVREEGPLEAEVINISERGMLLETSASVDVGTQLDFTFTLPGDAGELRVVGQVVRKAPSRPGTFRAGVEFLILRGDARERIRAFIEAEKRP